MLVTRMMFICRSTAPTTASSPATEPVWASAACWPAGLEPDLERHDRLARRVGPLRGLGEPRRVADLLEEQADHLGGVVLDQVVDDVDGLDHRLVAHGGQRAQRRWRAAWRRSSTTLASAPLCSAMPTGPGGQRRRQGQRERARRWSCALRKPRQFGPRTVMPWAIARGDHRSSGAPALLADLAVAGGEHDGVAHACRAPCRRARSPRRAAAPG